MYNIANNKHISKQTISGRLPGRRAHPHSHERTFPEEKKFGVKRLPANADRLKSVMTQECTGPRWGVTATPFPFLSRFILAGIMLIRIFVIVI